MLWKCCTQYVSKFGKLSRGHRNRKGQLSFQSQRKAMPKNAWGFQFIHIFINTCYSIFLMATLMGIRTSLVAQRLKSLPAMQETWVRSLGWEDPLDKEMATYSSILAWRIPWTEEPGGLQSTGLQRVGHDWATSLSLSMGIKYLFIFLLATCSSYLKK